MHCFMFCVPDCFLCSPLPTTALPPSMTVALGRKREPGNGSVIRMFLKSVGPGARVEKESTYL